MFGLNENGNLFDLAVEPTLKNVSVAQPSSAVDEGQCQHKYVWNLNLPSWYPAHIIPSVTFNISSHSLQRSRGRTGTTTSLTDGS